MHLTGYRHQGFYGRSYKKTISMPDLLSRYANSSRSRQTFGPQSRLPIGGVGAVKALVVVVGAVVAVAVGSEMGLLCRGKGGIGPDQLERVPLPTGRRLREKRQRLVYTLYLADDSLHPKKQPIIGFLFDVNSALIFSVDVNDLPHSTKVRHSLKSGSDRVEGAREADAFAFFFSRAP